MKKRVSEEVSNYSEIIALRLSTPLLKALKVSADINERDLSKEIRHRLKLSIANNAT